MPGTPKEDSRSGNGFEGMNRKSQGIVAGC